MEPYNYNLCGKVYSGMNELANESPDLMKGFGMLCKTNALDKTLSKKEKELLAVAIAIVVHCEESITRCVKDALEAGATHNQVIEVVGVAILMGGGPALVYGTMALNAVKEFEEKQNN